MVPEELLAGEVCQLTVRAAYTILSFEMSSEAMEFKLRIIATIMAGGKVHNVKIDVNK